MARRGVTLVLVGQTLLVPAPERMPELDERLGVKCLVKRFTPAESMAYISHRLTAACGAVTDLRYLGAGSGATNLSHGVARQINRLCDLALLIGFADERPGIGAAQIEAVADELVAVTPE